MPAYLIADIDVTDPAGFEAYRQRVPTTLQPYGGRFLVRGGAVEALEGDWQPKRVVITAFPSLEQARRWDNSEAYREPKALRFKTATSKVMLVEGVERRQVTRPQSPHAVQRLPPEAAPTARNWSACG